jgi:HD-GYP domain-containing protein (c-di-GMP phosphodiesterase class II)
MRTLNWRYKAKERMHQTSASFQKNSRNSDSSIALSEIISALSYALDLTEGAVHGHALRSCLLGMRIAEEAKLPSDQITSLYFALLLKDVGCSSNAGRMCEIVGGDDRAVKSGSKFEDWTRPYKPTLPTLKLLWHNVLPDSGAPAKIARILRIGATPNKNQELINLRSDRGASIIRKLGMGELAANAVRSLDEHWDGSGYPDSAKGEQIPLLARICAIAQHLDVFSANRCAREAIATLQQRSGTWFDPQLVRAAVSLHRDGRLWTHCSSTDPEQDTRQAVLDLDRVGRRHKLDAGQIDQICEAFADVVDAKSHFTFRHSVGVADAAFGIAMNLGLSPDRVQLVRRAALLHDVGKLGVSNTILDKRTRLTDEEWNAVYRHPGITRSVLERIGPFQEMAVIAGEHHEKLDGSGYPNRLMSQDLSLESRIIAVADVYGALSEDRPYRPGLKLDETLSIMKKLVPTKLDAPCFDALIAHVSPMSDTAITPVLHMPDRSLIYAFESTV